MQVETFECVETSHEPIEATEEAIGLIEQLGLEGQKELIAPADEGESVSRCPYPQATAEQLAVFELLCPEKVRMDKYRRTVMPLRVLQVAAHAQSLNFFTELQVWDHTSQQTQDPVLVGIVKAGYDERVYLLARWAEHLDEWPAMLKHAQEAYRAQFLATLANIKSKVEAKIREATSATLSVLWTNRTKRRSMPTYYD